MLSISHSAMPTYRLNMLEEKRDDLALIGKLYGSFRPSMDRMCKHHTFKTLEVEIFQFLPLGIWGVDYCYTPTGYDEAESFL